MVEQTIGTVKKIDRGLYKIGKRINLAKHAFIEGRKASKYFAHKEAVDSKLDYLGREIAAAEQLISSAEGEDVKNKISGRMGLIGYERSEIVRKLPLFKRREDKEDLERIRQQYRQNSQNSEPGAESSPLQKQAITPDREPHLKESRNRLNPVVKEGPVSPEDMQGVFGAKPLRIIEPVVAGGAGVISSGNTIPRDHIEYASDRIDPAMQPVWRSSNRDRMVFKYPEDPNEGRFSRFMKNLTGRNKYGPYVRSDSDGALWYNETGDPSNRELFIKRTGAGLGAMAALGVAALGIGWLIRDFRAPEVRANDLSAADRSAITQQVNRAVENQTGQVASSVTSALEPKIESSVNAAVDKAFEQREGEFRSAVTNAVTSVRAINAPVFYGLPVADLGSTQVVEGNLEGVDQVAKAQTGNGRESFVKGMAEYIIMKNYKDTWGITGEVNPYNPAHKAKLQEYADNPATDQFYSLEVLALQNHIMHETIQRFPGRGSLFRWANVDGREEVMIRHVAEDGTQIVPVLPDEAAAAKIINDVRRYAY